MNTHNNSGQMLLVAALAISLIIASTTAYVYDVGKPAVSVTGVNSLKEFVLSIQLGSKHIIIGALSNISKGGQESVLSTMLEKWASFIESRCLFGKIVLHYTTTNVSPYSSGVWLFWGDNGFGVSSASVSFNFYLDSKETVVHSIYNVNVTTALKIQGTYSNLSESQKLVDTVCHVFNDGASALAQNFTVFYESTSGWQKVSHYSLLDFGNGTYTLSFTVPNIRQVSVLTNDLRNIWVMANTTCTQV
jgi:hypothetical protein